MTDQADYNEIQITLAKPTLRLVLKLRDLDGKTYKEIGDILGVTRQRAWSLYKKAKTYQDKGWLQ